jgi:O-antigen/teichoic acid export membrane protein
MAGARATVLLVTFLRNLLLARLIGAEDYGIAVSYSIALGLLEAAFEFGPDKYIVHARDGGSPDMLAAAHTFTVGRGLCAGLVLFLGAAPIADLFHVPHLAWAYQLLALAPIIRGFVHFDFRRRQRDLSYRQEIAITLFSALAGFLVALGVALVEASHVAMLASLLAQISVFVALSYVVADTHYRLSVARHPLATLLRFGWPLVLNSIIIAAATGGDQAIVGSSFGPETLAVYAATATLIGGPFLILQTLPAQLMLPVLGPLRGQALFQARYERFGAGVALSAVITVVPLAVLGPVVVPLLFGSGFRPDPLVVAALAAVGGLSLLRAWTNLAALAVGHSKATLYTNLVRLSGLAVAVGAAALGGGVAVIALAMAFGELAALIYGLAMTGRIINLPPLTGFDFVAPAVALICATVALAPFTRGWTVEAALAAAAAGTMFGVIVLVCSSAEARQFCFKLSASLPR